MLTVLRDKTRRFFEHRRAAREAREAALRREKMTRDEWRIESIEEDRRRWKRLDAKRQAELVTMFLADCDPDRALPERTLVVIDMQPAFLSGYKADELHILLDSVGAQIIDARRRGWPIVFLEFLPEATYGRTNPELLALVAGYEHRYDRRGKDERSGAGEILRSCAERDFGRQQFQICGIYTDQCVNDTVVNLALNNLSSQVYVVPSACRSYAQVANTEQLFDWLQFPRCENINLIPARTAYQGHAGPLLPVLNQDGSPAAAHAPPMAPLRQCP